ncbi:MAG: NAD(P)-dependent alcohol dehydrogenase [Planctomycetes bacterium]|nr:NAD(P)-dependent alcohol dehydrogenase [Planctomycetota bacterium]
MHAIVQDKYGSAEVLVLRDIEKPKIAPDEVLVRVVAAGVDRGVWHIVTGQPYLMRAMGFGLRRPKIKTPGMDLAGVVEAVGEDVTRFKLGDEVFGTTIGGQAYAEFASLKQDKLVHKPNNLSFEEAAAVPVSALAALKGVRDVANVQPGQSVLIIGASGGVGHYAVQIAKSLGAVVTGVASTAKLDMVRAMGADHVIDYKNEDVTDSGTKYDVIIDIGGNRKLRKLRRALAKHGTLVITGGEGGGKWFGGIDRQLRALMWSPFVSQKLTSYISLENREDLETLKDMIEAGKLKPSIDRTFPLAQAADAIRYLESGHVSGKIVLKVA